MFVMKKVGRLMEGGEMLAAYRARSDSDERKRDRKTKRIILSEYNRQMFAKGIFAKSFRQAAKRTATARRAFVAVALASAASLSQSKGETSHAAALEFPVVLQQNVVAGKTAVGAKVQAKLTIATLLHGVVIPQDAVISGEVIESVAKSATEPSRVAVRMDTAQWKNGAAPSVLPLETKLYLTAWYYPLVAADYNSATGDADPPLHVNSRDTSRTIPVPTTPVPGLSQHRAVMKYIESVTGAGGAIVLTSKHSNIKLDKSTTYVLAAGELQSAK
jgi:hypothetical protein